MPCAFRGSRRTRHDDRRAQVARTSDSRSGKLAGAGAVLRYAQRDAASAVLHTLRRLHAGRWSLARVVDLGPICGRGAMRRRLPSAHGRTRARDVDSDHQRATKRNGHHPSHVDLLWSRTIERRTIDVKPLSVELPRVANGARRAFRMAIGELGGLAPAARFFTDLQPPGGPRPRELRHLVPWAASVRVARAAAASAAAEIQRADCALMTR